MRQSLLLARTRRSETKQESSVSAGLLTKAGFVDRLMAGVYTFLPLGNLVLNKIENIIREEMLAIGSQEVLLPALHPVANWETTGRWDVEALLKVQSRYADRVFALGPTHEEVITPLVKRFLQSYKDLPISLFQIQTKFRDEARPRSGILRGREFRMKDMYSFHASQEDLDRYYDLVQAAYHKIYARLGLGDKTYLTYAAGGTFSKFSHEFQTLAGSGEDTIYVCKERKFAINREIFEQVRNLEEFRGCEFVEERAIEVGNIFKLGSRFSDAFELNFLTVDGETKPVLMGCYGLGSSRVMGTIVEAHHDQKGIVWPASVAPYQVHLLPIGDNDQVSSEADRLYNQFTAAGIEVLYDDRTNLSAGIRLNDCDLIGIPIRIIVSEKSLASHSAEITMRNNNNGSQLLPVDHLCEHLRSFLALLK